jgi:transcriptional antiterminator NusG
MTISIDDRPGIWHIARTEPRREYTALSDLTMRGVRCAAPKFRERKLSGRRMQERDTLFFPTYLFVRVPIGMDAYDVVGSTRGILAGQPLLKRAGTDTPAVMPDEAMRIVADVEALKLRAHLYRRKGFEVGEVVRVIEGPFAGFNGKVFNIDRLADDDRIAVLMDLFSRPTPVMLEVAQVEPV